VSDQKIPQQIKNNEGSNNKKKPPVANSDLDKMNILAMLDRKMMNGGGGNNINQHNNLQSPGFKPLPSKPYQSTDNIIQQIQSIIQ
jgi:hypothetical protein